MALLKSVDNVPGIDYYEYRDHEYYNKYKYKTNFILNGVRYLWDVTTPYKFDSKLKLIPSLEKKTMIENKQKLLSFIEWRLANTGKGKSATIRVERNSVSVFSNDLSILKTLSVIDPDLKLTVTEAKTTEYAGVKYFVNEPKHKFRVYMSGARVDNNLYTELTNFLKSQKNLYLSNSFKRWVAHGRSNWRTQWISSVLSIDYDDENMLSYLMLMYGNLIGKRYKLEKRPEDI